MGIASLRRHGDEANTPVSENPYLDEYQSALDHQSKCGPQAMIHTFGGASQPNPYCMECIRARPASAADVARDDIKRRYSWAVPDDAALDAIAEHSPNGVVEIGAGGGYWAGLLRARGVNVIAYDPDPEGGPEGWHHGHRWSDVLIGDHTSVVGHSTRTLLLVWPSYDRSWTDQVLDLYDGDTVVYVGEGSGGCTGSDRMHILLGGESYCWHDSSDPDDVCTHATEKVRFAQVEDVSIPQWWCLHDRLGVYKRIAGAR